MLLEVLGARSIFSNDQACKKGSEVSPMCGLRRGAAVMGMCRWCQGKLAFRLGVSKQVDTMSHAVLILLWHSALNDPIFPVSSARCKTNYGHLLSFLKAQGHLALPIVLRGMICGAESLSAVAACNISITLNTAPYPCPGEPATPAGR